MLIIGSHVGFNKSSQLLGSLEEALSYGSNTFMFYTGAPQNTNRAPIKDDLTISAKELMKRPEISYFDIVKMLNLDNPLPYELGEELNIEVKYAGYIEKSYKDAKKMLKLETIKIPEDLDYSKIPNIASEAKEKLAKVKPFTVSQAMRISGVNPSDIAILLVYLESRKK